MKLKSNFLFLLTFLLPLLSKPFLYTEENSAPLVGTSIAPGAENKKVATIKVLLEEKSEGVLLEAKGPFQVFNPENGKKLSFGRKKRFYLYPHKEGIKWGENFLGIFQLQLLPAHPDTTFLINGIQYRGSLEVYHIEDKLSIINEVDVESYLKSILKEKISSSFPSATLDALAIVARTDAYYTALFNAGAYWHVKAKEVGYDGFGLVLEQLEIDRSIDDTRHLVLTYEKQPFPSSWTAHCGGKTANYQTIFRKNTPTPNGVHSPFAYTTREENHWTTHLDAQFLASLAKMNRITRVELFQDPLSNKVYALRLYDGVHKEDLDFFVFQEKLKEKKLKSNEFTVSVKGDLVQFDGVGEGYGVGLCLYSATQMAKKGDLAPKILSAFYPTTQLEKMRSYPQMIISSEEGLFVSPNQHKKLRKLLH